MGGDKFAGKVVKALAETFSNHQAHYERGIEAYELLLKLDPTSPEAGEWVLQIAAAYFTPSRTTGRLKATYQRALDGYTTGGPWSRTQAEPGNVAETSREIEEELREHAVGLHGRPSTTRRSRRVRRPRQSLYEVYLSKFAQEPDAFQLEYYLGGD